MIFIPIQRDLLFLASRLLYMMRASKIFLLEKFNPENKNGKI
jgi:hypothetical protein